MVQLPDFSRVYEIFQSEVYGVPVTSIVFASVAALAVGWYLWKRGHHVEATVVQDEKSGLPSAKEYGEQDEDERVPQPPPSSPTVLAYSPPPPAKVEGYCVKCKTNREIKGAKESKLKNGKPALKGWCSLCGTKMVKFLFGPPRLNGHDSAESILIGILMERLKTAPISGGRLSLNFDPSAPKQISISKSQIDFDLGIPVSYTEHSSEVEELKRRLEEANAKIESIAATQHLEKETS